MVLALKRFFAVTAYAILVTGSIGITVAQEDNSTSSVPTAWLGTHYSHKVTGISLTDTDTGIEDIKTIFNYKSFDVLASLSWETQTLVPNSTNTLLWEMYIDNILTNTGSIDLTDSRSLPDHIDAGSATVSSSGTHNIAVKAIIDNTGSTEDAEYQSFNGGASFAPLIMVLIFAMTTKNVELSLGLGIFTGACMVTGTIVDGFKTTLDTYILEALANVDHGFVYLFTLFLSGMVGEIQRVGGLDGITVGLERFVKSPRSAQVCTMLAGILIFFDDYANTLVAGMSMRPLSDLYFVSREKLAFIVDATAAPIASIVPISAWVGFEVNLIQTELDKILEKDPDAQISNTGFGVFLETIKYRYYCIFMLLLIPLLIGSQRDMGPMLLAERRCRIHKRTDGGDGAAVKSFEVVDKNAPADDTPCRWWNMAIPILALVGYIFGLLVVTGDDGTGTQTFMQKIEESDSYSALLWGTMAAALTAFALFMLQDKKDGHIVWFNVKGHYNRFKRALNSNKCIRTRCTGGSDPADDTNTNHSKPLITWWEAMEAFLVGMEKIFPALVVLTLAWAMGSVVVAVGLDRFFGDLIVNGNLSYQAMPTISYLVSMFVAFATGTSWGTMTIMFPLLLVPTYISSSGDPEIFYATTGGILAGAVAGDHASPISDTTVLSSLTSECLLLNHVKTQAPYVIVVTIWVVLVGTVPIGMGSYPNGVAIFLGFVMMCLHVIFTAAPHLNKTGRYDIITEVFLKCFKDEELEEMRELTAKAYREEVGDGVVGWRALVPWGRNDKSKKESMADPTEAHADDTDHLPSFEGQDKFQERVEEDSLEA